MTWFLLALKRYAAFSGRSHRKEYWMFVLWLMLIGLALMIVDTVIGTFNDEAGWGLLSGLFFLVTLVPYLSLTARRLHDIDRSGWFQLLFIIPIVGFILWIVWMVTDGSLGPNKYGPSPKLAGPSPVTGASA